MALDFLAGCVGGAAGVIVGHPLDTVKVRLQTQDPSNLKYRGTFHCLSTIVKQESVSGLYKGISSPLFGVAGVNAIIFGVYGALRPYVSSSPGNDALWAHFAAGSISGAVQSVVASPMELVKTRMQINEDSVGSKKVGPVEVLRGIYKNEGGLFRGVFKGWGITLGREIPGFGFYFASYEALTRFGDGEVGTLGMMLAGGMAGVISWIVTFPIDVVKTRLQCDDRGKYTGIIDCIRKTYSSEGHRAFTRGLVSTVIRAFPTNAATFTVVTWIMRFAGETQEDDVKNSRQYMDELLRETTQLQKRFEDSLRLKVPQYFFNGNSLTSCSLASQCAASAQGYADRTQVYFNFYQSLQQQAQHATSRKERDESEEGEVEDEEESVGVQQKNRVSLLHEKLAMHMHDNDEQIHISGRTENSAYSNMQGVSQKGHSSEQQKVASRRSQVDASAVVGVDCYKNDNEKYNSSRDNAVRHNNHIPSTSQSSSSAITNVALVERETNAKPVDTISCDEIESPTTVATATILTDGDSVRNMEVSSDRDSGCRSSNNIISSTRTLIHGNKELSHEASSFPVKAIESMITSTNNAGDHGHEPTTGGIECERNAVKYLNSYEDHDDDADNNAEALSSTDLAYLSKSLDIPVHILKAASLKQTQSSGDAIKSDIKSTLFTTNENKITETSTPTLTRRGNVGANNAALNSRNKATQAWRKYCKTPALNFCKCFEDHCVCYV